MRKLWRQCMIDRFFCHSHITVTVTAHCTVVTAASQSQRHRRCSHITVTVTARCTVFTAASQSQRHRRCSHITVAIVNNAQVSFVQLLGSVSPVLSKVIGWEERLRNDIFCQVGRQTLLNRSTWNNRPHLVLCAVLAMQSKMLHYNSGQLTDDGR